MNEIIKAGLTPKQRQVATLFLEGRTREEIAIITGVTPRTVKATLQRIAQGLEAYDCEGKHNRVVLARRLCA